MKYRYILAFALVLATQANAANKDSVYSWGAWTQNIQPAAGPALPVTPTAVTPTEVNFRPNENSAFNRAAPVEVVVTLPIPAPAVIPEAPQLPNIVIVPSSTPSSPIGDL